MMKLELMKQFYETVDEEWRSPIASTITAEWFGAGAETWVWRASANFVCVVAAADRKYYLRFNHDSERQPEFIASELDYIEALDAAGLKVANPVRSRAGNLIEGVSTPLGPCRAVMFQALPGEQREFNSITLKDFETWGRALGRVHSLSAGLSDTQRPAWTDDVHMARRFLPNDEEPARSELDAVEARLSSLNKSQDTYGLIHYDFELDNLMWEGDRIGILDFDDCAYYWYVADIAYALRDLFGDSAIGVDLGDEKLQSFVRGYRLARSVPDEEITRIPLLLRLHNLVAFARISRSLGPDKPDDEPEWASNLRCKLRTKMDAYREDFAKYPSAQIA